VDSLDAWLAGDPPNELLSSLPADRTPLLARRLLLRARHLSEAEQSLRLADMALEVIDRIEDPAWGADYLWAIRIEARLVRVEALFKEGDLDQAISEVQPLLAAATPEIGARLRGDVHFLAALIYLQLGESDQAHSLLSTARDLYGVVEAPARLGRALLHLSELYRSRGELARALDATSQAVTLFKGERDPRASFCARHNLALYLCEANRPSEAGRQLELSRAEYASCPHPLAVLSSRWVEARVCEQLGEIETAITLYGEVQTGFVAARLPRHLVNVSLDLVTLLVDHARIAAAKAAVAVVADQLREGDSDETLGSEVRELLQELERSAPSIPRLRRRLLQLRTVLEGGGGSRQASRPSTTSLLAQFQ
jgi:tetratricopeptide (TPR) repeat protein